MPVETACAAAKVAKPTVYKWLKQERSRVAVRKAQDEAKSLETPSYNK
jgi:hypothetical protein